MGTSFGAVAALSTAVRFPGTYGSLLLQSGSFLYSDPACGMAKGPTSIRWCASLIVTAPPPYALRSERSSPAGRTRIWSRPTAECCRSSAAPG